MFNKCELRGPNIQYLTLINSLGLKSFLFGVISIDYWFFFISVSSKSIKEELVISLPILMLQFLLQMFSFRIQQFDVFVY
jgi:hypothetical protein